MDNRPTYIAAASIHSESSAESGSVFDSISNAPKFWGLALGSGAVSIANSFITLGNLFQRKEDQESQINFGKWLADYDTDFAKYYRENATSIDTWGFVASSFLPGIGGIKALNLGQKALTTAASTGQVGRGLSWATGLLVPKTETYIANAAKSLANSTSAFRFLQKDVIKAVGSKFHQNALESAAFEVGVLATMHQSPFFEDMTTGDMIWNAGVGLLLGTGIGGVIGSSGIKSGVMKEVSRLDEAGNVVRQKSYIPSSAPAGVRLSLNYENKRIYDDFIQSTDQTKPGVAGETVEIVKQNINIARNSIRATNNEGRTLIREMTIDKGNEVGNYFADVINGLEPMAARNLTLGADNFARIATVPRKTIKEPGKLRPTKLAEMEDGWSFSRLFGDGEGMIMDQANLPKVFPLADKVVPKSAGKSLKETVDRLAEAHKHRLDDYNHDVRNVKTQSVESVQTRYLRAAQNKFSFNFKKPVQIYRGDYPVLEALRAQKANIPNELPIRILDSKGKVLAETTKVDLEDFILRTKQSDIEEMLRQNVSPEEISERLNVSPGYVTGVQVSDNMVENMFYRQSIVNKLNRDQKVPLKDEDIFYRPQYMAVKENKGVADNLYELDNDVSQVFEMYRDVAQQTVDVAASSAVAQVASPELQNVFNTLPEAKTLNQVALDSSRLGPGGGALTFMNGNYFTPEAIVQYVGNVKGRLDSLAQGRLDEKLKGVADNIKMNQAAAVELQTINEIVANTGEIYYLEQGVLKNRKLVEWEKKLADEPDLPAPELPPNVPGEISINNPATADFIAKHIELNGERVTGQKLLRAAQGTESHLDPLGFYPIKPDPTKYNHFVILKDNTMSGQGASKMLHAASKGDLERLVQRVQNEFGDRFQIISKQDSKEFYKARGEYDYDLAIQDPYIDSALHSKGINSQFIPITDPVQIADNFTIWHKKQARMFNADLIGTKYEQAFKELEAKGREFSRLNEATYTSLGQLATEAVDNPYVNYIKTALNISREADYPMLNFINKGSDAWISRLWNQAESLWSGVRGGPNEQTLETINQVFKDHGFQTATYDASLALWANHPAGTNALSKFVRGANGLLATTFLRMDWLNALNNKLGSIILTSTELRHLTNGIKRADPEAAGKLAKISEVLIPGTDNSILAPTKLISNSLNNFLTRPDLVDNYKSLGFITDSVTAARGLMDDLVITGTETETALRKKLSNALEKARKLQDTNKSTKYASTVVNPLRLNQFTEDLNRFMAADISRQIGELAVEAGVISPREIPVIQNTFVNRTQVNLNRSQRPMVFQGPVGMALGLFQSYQFNMMQQLFRYVQPGQRKTAAMLMGMQSSIYGMNGVPGFQALNEYIIGQAAGNSGHEDMYSSIFRAAGDAAPWIMYGAPSNILNTNLYTRGDLTPQHPTILPSSPLDFPVVAKTGQFFGNLKNTVSNIAGGVGIWDSLVTGLEHNSINRPLAGLAQVMRGLAGGKVYGTDRAGNLLSSNDLLSLTSLSRIAGGKPLDESIARDNMWRTSVYRAADAEKRKSLGAQAARLFGSGNEPDYDEMLEKYIQYGGKQAGFNRWIMNQMTRATTSQAEIARQRLSDPYSERLQVIMGGMSEEDFTLQ